MIVNFVTDEYLERFYPDILNYKQGGEIDYAGRITTAVEHVLDDLTARNIKARNCMVPIDLNRTTKTIQQLTQLVSSDLTFVSNKYYSKMYESMNQRRAFISVSAKTQGDIYRLILVGSNAATPADASDASCEDILTFEYLANAQASDKNQTFTQEYKWYGYRLEKDAANTGALTFKAAVYETVYDRLIAYKALELIAMSWRTGQNPRWDERRDDMRKEYENLLETIRINVDADEDGVPEEAEAGKKVGATIGSISTIA